VATETAGTGCGDAPAEACVERCHPQFDCVSSYVWIWERLIQVAGRTEIDARHIRRDPPAEHPRVKPASATALLAGDTAPAPLTDLIE
jgi:hypothetical protein